MACTSAAAAHVFPPVFPRPRAQRPPLHPRHPAVPRARQTADFLLLLRPEKQKAIEKLRGKPEITRFKGLGEISPNEFGAFIGDDIRLDPVILPEDTNLDHVLGYYMGKNTPERQDFIIENLRVELDIIDTPEEEAQIEPVSEEEILAEIA
jgi:DNA gyrase/topoisomerase IV subunit B